jgi:GH24 family phage-related lysozyme (muramidase)
MSRLAEIYKSEKAKGGGIASALGKRALEKIDPRRMFNQKGLAAAIAPSLFKTYSATRTTGKSPTSLSAPAPQISTMQLESKIDGLTNETRNVSLNTQLAAKNSMTLPDIARDMNVMRQNIVKLVKLQGGEATNKADMYFRKSSERESAYETQFGKQKGVAPTLVTSKEPEKNTGILGFLSTLFAPLLTLGGTIVSAITATLGSIFSPDNLVKVFGLGLDVIKGISTVFRTLLPLLTSPVFLGLVGGLLAAKWLMDLIDKKNSEANTKAKTDLRIAQDRGSQSSKVARRTFLINDELKSYLKDDRTDEELSDFTSGEIRTKDELRAKIAEAEALGKRAIEIKESRVVKEQQDIQHADALKSQADGSIDAAEMRRMKIAPTPTSDGGAGAGRGGQGGPTAEQLSPTPVPSDGLSEDLVNYVKKKEGFTAKAIWDHKQWSIGYGTKANSENEVITEKEADSRLRERLKKDVDFVDNFAKKNKYDWNQGQKDALTSFVYNLGSGSLNSLTANGTRTNEQIGQKILEYNKASNVVNTGLVKRRTEESTMFAGYSPSVAPPSSTMVASASQVPPRPSTGSALTTSSVQVASAGQAGTTIINNNTTNNSKTGGGGQGTQGTPNIPSAFDDVFTTLFGRVA